MNNVSKPMRTLVNTAVMALLPICFAHAGSFSLYTEASPAALGNYGAGVAAEAQNASTSWFNPAGLPLLENTQLNAGLIGVFPTSKITGTSRFSTPPLPDYVQTFANLEGAKDAAVPSLHYAKSLGDSAAFGISLVAPFGLATEWSTVGPVRYEATQSKLLTSTISPAIGGKITSNFLVGLGLDLQYAKVTFNRVLGAPVFAQAIGPFIGNPPPTFLDATSVNKGDSVGVGFHAGVLFKTNDDRSRLGINYQSEMKHRFHGHSTLKGALATPDLNIFSPASLLAANPNAQFRTNNLRSNLIEFPDILTISGYHDLTPSLAVLASVVYTGWHTFKTIELDNVAAYTPELGQVPVNATATQFYRDTWRYALGVNYHFNERMMVRLGGGYDQTPTNDANRDVRIADADRWALSIGAHYQARPNIGVDVGYTHLFSVRNSAINKTDEVGSDSTFNVLATAKGSADLVGMQVNWLMDDVTPPTK